jgi:UDP-N-acetylmuramoyl-L-alanyl-D-glutamate--2,6-diaminopimelate ligase
VPDGDRATAGIPRPAGVVPVALTSLANVAGPGARLVGSGVAVTGVTMSSGLVRAGDLFVAAPGRAAHGARYAEQAVAAGAVAVLTDADGAISLAPGTPVVVVPDVRAAVGPVASAVYGDPSGELDVLGVTGTSGKTTTTYFLRAGLRAAGRISGLIGTVATLIGEKCVKTGFTTPEAPELHALLAVMREHGATNVAMEVSSHALAMRRVGGIGFAVGAFTNLSEDHLDFHADMEDYFRAKALLFDATESPVIVVDDAWGRRMAELVGRGTTVSTGGTEATWRASDIEERADGSTRFRVHGPHGTSEAGCAVPGRYNVANALLALAMLHENGVPVDVAAPAIATATVPGRMERIDAGQPFLAVVDYSHKPAAVEGALAALRRLTPGRLIVVLGCGGDRDRAKRPVMGRIAARDADLLIVTDDNPRSEDPAAIRRAMLDGAHAVPAQQRGEIREVGDRAEAIRTAVSVAAPGDTVLVAGKGHEPGQDVAGVVHPFDDRVVLRSALAGGP